MLIDRDPLVKLIVNARNFGHLSSSFDGLLQASGDCVIVLVNDLQNFP